MSLFSSISSFCSGVFENVTGTVVTNFQKVKEFNDVGKVSRPTNPVEYLKIYQQRLDLLKEEVKEMHQSVVDENFIEYRDALADILYIAYGTADVLSIDIDDLFVQYLYGDGCLSTLINSFTRRHTNFELLNHHLQFPKKMYESRYDDFIKEFEDIQNPDYHFNLHQDLEDVLVRLIIHVYSHCRSLDIDIDKDFDAVHYSNMTKFCRTESEAVASVKAQLEKKDRRCYHVYNTKYRLYVIKINGSDKITKGINYIPPVLN